MLESRVSYADYSALDRPEFLQLAFHPRKDFTRPPPNSTDYLILVERDVSVTCRFYVHSKSSPSILFFHGNGEVVSDYDYIAPIYNELGINLFVADYRGYGSSGGSPTFTNTITDAHGIFEGFGDALRLGYYSGDIFVMGRSLGSMSAIELAHSYGEKIKGLIIESGVGSMVKMITQLGFPMEFIGITDTEFPNLSKIRNIALPTLIIHAEFDNLAPLAGAQELFESSAAGDKRLEIIPGADHNTILIYGIEPYFEAIRDFIFG